MEEIMKKNFLTFITLLILVGGFTETKYALAEKTELKTGLILFVEIRPLIEGDTILELADLQAAYSLKFNPLMKKARDFNREDDNLVISDDLMKKMRLVRFGLKAVRDKYHCNKRIVQRKIKLVIELIAKRLGAIAVLTCFQNMSDEIGVCAAIYRDPALDITEEVIETVNKEYLAEGMGGI